MLIGKLVLICCPLGKAAACLYRFREWMAEVIQNEMKYALSMNSRTEAIASSIAIRKWEWMVVNSSLERQNLPLELYADPRVLSYKTQYVFGHEN